MYRKEKPLVMKTSASAVSNNLSIHIDRSRNCVYYAVAHKHTVNVISVSMDGSAVSHRAVVCREPASNQTSAALQARIVQFSQRVLLIVTSTLGIQVYDLEQLLLIYWYALGDGQTETYGRGICGINSDILCVGKNDGSIICFEIPRKGSNVVISQTVKKHTEAICDLSSDGSYLASSDNGGVIVVWDAQREHYEPLIVINGKGYPCTSVRLWKDFVIGGYGSGHLRVYNKSSGDFCCEVTAHARWIHAIDVAANGLLLSAGEDMYVRVWKLSSSSPQVTHVYSEYVADTQLQGAQFVDRADGAWFGCIGYEYCEICFFRKGETQP